MTTPYFLDKQELLLLVEFNISGNRLKEISFNGDFDSDTTLSDDIIRLFNHHFFKDLLKKQPELKPVYQQFVQKLKNEPNLEENTADKIFAHLFEGKIKLEHVFDQFLNAHPFFKEESRRLYALEFIFERYKPILLLTHNYITKHDSVNSTISGFYCEMLRHCDQHAMGINRDEILDNLHNKCFTHIKNNEYKLDIILALKPHDMNLYQHIIDKFEPLMRNDINILNLFESRLHFFDKATKECYANNKIMFNVFEEKESYQYEYQLSKNYVMQTCNLSNNVANDFLLPFHHAIGSLLTAYFNGESTRNVNAIHYSFKSLQDKENAKDFCRLISNNIAPLMTESVYRNPYNTVKEKVIEYAERLYFADQLAKDLPVTASKASRKKI